MKQSAGVLVMLFTLTACTLSDTYKTAFDGCMSVTSEFDDDPLRYDREVRVQELTKLGYCHQLTQQVTRDLRRRGALLD